MPIAESVEGESKDVGWSYVGVDVLHTSLRSVSRRLGIFQLFTSDFAVEAGECDGKGLHGTQRVLEVQRENVIGYSSKLHHNVVH